MAREPEAPDELPEDRLRAEFHAQTAKIPWQSLQTHYARGAVVWVSPALDLVDVAVHLHGDDKARFEQWIAEGSIEGISDERGQQLYDENPMLWAVVAPPWVLVQPCS